MAVLAVREYQNITCGDVFDPVSRTVTRPQRNRLEGFNEAYRRHFKTKVFEYGRRESLIAQNYVGVIDLGRDQIEVLPKIEGAEESEIRHNLAEMIAIALDVNISEGTASSMKQPAANVLEILIRLFCAQLWAAVHSGMVRRYENKSEDLPVLRGRLNVVRQIRRHATRHDLLACDYDEFSENNALNQVLKVALQALSGVARTAANERSIAELLFCFEDVEDVPPAHLRWHQATADRLSKRYKPLLHLARLFIDSKAPDVVSGKGEGFALLFDMNELFEKYIGRVVKRLAAGTSITINLQGPVAFLAHREGAGQAFELRPDIVAEVQGKVAWLADTKWKRLDTSDHREGLLSSDMYQMHAYAKRYEVENVVLIYPHHSGLGLWKARRASYRFIAGGMVQQVSVATIDLRNLNSVANQLGQVLFAHVPVF